ncbi:MAG: hypothetical protein ABL921_02475, partial [Pirellula sp.]
MPSSLSINSLLGIVTVIALANLGTTMAADEFPKVDVTNIRRVFHNGEHNAFTDLVRFRNRFYLTFRSCP